MYSFEFKLPQSGFSSTHNIKHMGFSVLRRFGSRSNFLVGGQVRSPKTQPFHIVKRYSLCLKNRIPNNKFLL